MTYQVCAWECTQHTHIHAFILVCQKIKHNFSTKEGLLWCVAFGVCVHVRVHWYFRGKIE